jgi:hypothetical protein
MMRGCPMKDPEDAELVRLLLECSRLTRENQRRAGLAPAPEEPTEKTAEEVIDLLVALLEDRNRRIAESN